MRATASPHGTKRQVERDAHESQTSSPREGVANATGSLPRNNNTPDAFAADSSIYDIPTSSDEANLHFTTPRRRRRVIGSKQHRRSCEGSRSEGCISRSANIALSNTRRSRGDVAQDVNLQSARPPKKSPQPASTTGNVLPKPRAKPSIIRKVSRSNHSLGIVSQPENVVVFPDITNRSQANDPLDVPIVSPGSAYGNVKSPRKRMIDSLLADEKPKSDASLNLADGHPSPSFSSRTSPDVGAAAIPCETQDIHARRRNAETTQEVNPAPPSPLGTSRVTYARQRSFLDDMIQAADVEGHGNAPGPTSPSWTEETKLRPQRSVDPTTLFDEEENDVIECVQSIHELRQAGKIARFTREVESLMEEIEYPHSESGQCSNLIQLCSKLLQRDYALRFNDCNFNTRLVDLGAKITDPVPAVLSLCACDLSQSRTPWSATVLATHWSRLLDAAPTLLDIDDDVLTISKRAPSGLSKAVRSRLSDIVRRLLSASPEDAGCTKLTPRVEMLKCLQRTSSHLRDTRGDMATMSSAVLERLVDIIGKCVLDEVPGGDHMSVDKVRILDLTLSVLETCTVIPGTLPDNYQDACKPLYRLHRLLDATALENRLSNSTLQSILRLLLNITNNDSSLCNDFATPDMIGGLVNIVLANFAQLCGDCPDSTLDLVILALGALVNLAEGSETAKTVFKQHPARSESFSQTLGKLFFDSIDSLSEVCMGPRPRLTLPALTRSTGPFNCRGPQQRGSWILVRSLGYP